MTRWLIDINVISELRRPRCDASVRSWIDSRDSASLFLSRVSIVEVRFGIARAPDAATRIGLELWLSDTLLPWFQDRILDADESVLLRWREMLEEGCKRGRTFSEPDLLLAATASAHGLSVATRNTVDFTDTGLEVVNPWTAAP